MASPAPAEVSVPIYTAAPLPPGWTEHRAPTGQFYYYHAESGESTYVRPSIPVLAPKEIDPNVAAGGSTGSGGGQKKSSTAGNKKKEKPKTKEPIPETAWMKVTTTAGNVFYTNVENKTSSWTVPEEIKEQLKIYEEAEARKAEETRLAELERVRLKAEEDKRIHEAEQRRMIELEVQKVRAEVEAEAELRGLKRRNEEPPHDPASANKTRANPPGGSDTDRKTKVAKLDSAADDEDWQRQIAEEMAQEAAQMSPTSTIPCQPNHLPPAAIPKNPPPPAGLSLEELKATFKAMLLEKSIDPMAPWDNELPKFVTDPRYLALPSMKERRDLFDEFCKEKIRQQRAAMAAVPKVDPPRAYRSLLMEVVTSTRTLWEDFKSKHKKDSRFRNFGRDDREREKAFKSWLKELGEQKRQQLAKAEADFRGLLAEKAAPAAGAAEEEYKDFKERVKHDPRFVALASNSSKEAMWKKWVEDRSNKADEEQRKNDGEDETKKKAEEEAPSQTKSQKGSQNGTVSEAIEDPKREKQMASLKAREEQVREMKKKVEKDAAINRALVDKDPHGLKP
ncbi:hypothetical protein PtB15_10B396 [Puccinia triticina]|nr:hypothetical protein PtB15_10B396 [Puccinia triticina]